MHELLMEEQFQLKYYGRYSLFEQNQMTAEDRRWTMRRIIKELKDKEEQEKKQMRSRPSMPSIRRK